jgi:hypothetical protein
MGKPANLIDLLCKQTLHDYSVEHDDEAGRPK